MTLPGNPLKIPTLGAPLTGSALAPGQQLKRLLAGRLAACPLPAAAGAARAALA